MGARRKTGILISGRGSNMQALIKAARDLLPDVDVQRIAGGGGDDTRIQLQTRDAIVKVEVSPVLRGTVMEPRPMRVTEPVEDEFGFAETLVVSDATVKTHVNHVFAKISARDRAQAVHYAYTHGLAERA